MKRRTRWDRCGLCGELRITTREHVVPRSLYPASKSNSRFQRITIAACVTCNNGTADDDAHFRNVVLVAGEPNEAVKELWSGPVRRGFAQVDGHRRARDIFDLMQPAPDVGPNRYRIFPADDPRILQIVRKIIRGLSRYHELSYPLSDGQVFADVMRQTIPEEILASMEHKEAEPDVLQYGYLLLDEPHGLSSVWVLRFFQRTTFIGFVFANEAARQEHMGH